MENAFYIYSKTPLIIERLHLCTWDIRGGEAHLEIGIEIENKDNCLSSECTINVQLPFEILNESVRSLHESLCDEKYSRYIFNDIIESTKIIDSDVKRGKVLCFKERGELAILPAKAEVVDGSKLRFSIPAVSVDSNVYVRVMIDTNQESLAEVKSGVAKKLYLFDYKINERRNIPEALVQEVRPDEFVQINSAFLFHVVPNDFEVTFYDSNKFKSLRKLEKKVFADYTGIEQIEKEESIILFNKESKKNSYSFYTSFSDEIIGTKQILLAIGANILCSLLFALPALRNSWDCSKSCSSQFPWEWIAAAAILVGLICKAFKRK